MSSSIRHRFLEWFSTKSILSASLSSRGSLQSPSFSPSPSPSSSCFLLAVANSAACLLRHFVLRFWNQTWKGERKRIETLLKINHTKSRCVFCLNHKTNRLIGRLFSIFHCHLTWCWDRRGHVKERKEGLNWLYLLKCLFSSDFIRSYKRVSLRQILCIRFLTIFSLPLLFSLFSTLRLLPRSTWDTYVKIAVIIKCVLGIRFSERCNKKCHFNVWRA